MTVSIDAALLLRYLDDQGIDGSRHVARGWQHIGAIIVDAVLQRRQRYKATVRPRVENLVAVWPEAATVSGFRKRIDEGGLSVAIRWKSEQRLTQIKKILAVFESAGIETVDDLRNHLLDNVTGDELHAALRKVKFVGPKTVDYIDILAGLDQTVAVDVRIRRFITNAGIPNLSYRHVSEVIHAAAVSRGWRPGDLDAAMWNA